jgi:hypothetical protein
MAQIIMIPKTNKDLVDVISYRPISLLPIKMIGKITSPETNACDNRIEANILSLI